jgi:hypothetical protein
MSEPNTQRSDPRDHYAGLLDSVLQAAWSVDSFGALCAILRVGGMEDANWDPFEESRSAFEDYNWMLERVREERGDSATRRVRLLMYCQAVEMSAPQEIPSSAAMKYRRVRALADEVRRSDVTAAVEAFFDERIRNAFSHSDYIISEDEFRFTDGGLPQRIPLQRLDELTVQHQLPDRHARSMRAGVENRWSSHRGLESASLTSHDQVLGGAGRGRTNPCRF